MHSKSIPVHEADVDKTVWFGARAVHPGGPYWAKKDQGAWTITAASFNGKSVRTIEGHAKNGQLTVLQKVFIEHFEMAWERKTVSEICSQFKYPKRNAELPLN